MSSKGSRSSQKTRSNYAKSLEKLKGKAKAEEVKKSRQEEEAERAKRRSQATAELREEADLAQALESVRKAEAEAEEDLAHALEFVRIVEELNYEKEIRKIAQRVVDFILNDGIRYEKGNNVLLYSASDEPIEDTTRNCSKIREIFKCIQDKLDGWFISLHGSSYYMRFYVENDCYIVKLTCYPSEYSAQDDMYDLYNDYPSANLGKKFYNIGLKMFLI